MTPAVVSCEHSRVPVLVNIIQHFQQTSMQEFQVRPYQRLAYGALDFAKTPVQLLLVS